MSNKLFILLTFLLLSIISAQERWTTDRCYYSGNNYFKIYHDNKTTSPDNYFVKCVLCGQGGYSSFSISNSTSDEKVKYTMLFWDDERNPGHSFQAIIPNNNFTHFYSSGIRINKILSQSRDKGFFIKLRQVYVELFKKYAKTKHHMIFRCHNSLKPKRVIGQQDLWIIPPPQERNTHFITKGL